MREDRVDARPFARETRRPKIPGAGRHRHRDEKRGARCQRGGRIPGPDAAGVRPAAATTHPPRRHAQSVGARLREALIGEHADRVDRSTAGDPGTERHGGRQANRRNRGEDRSAMESTVVVRHGIRCDTGARILPLKTGSTDAQVTVSCSRLSESTFIDAHRFQRLSRSRLVRIEPQPWITAKP